MKKFFHTPALTYGVNMDSGGVAVRPNKSKVGAVVDGVTESGLAAVLAAHLFAKTLLETLTPKSLFDESAQLKSSYKSLLENVCQESSKLTPNDFGLRKAAATIGFIDTKQLPDGRCEIVAASVGDVFLLHYSPA